MNERDGSHDATMSPPPAAADDAPGALSGDTDQLRQQLQAQTEAARQHYDAFLRERAELENFKRRMMREKAEALRFANEGLIRDLLPIVDNLERAVEHADAGGASVIEGVRL